MSTSPAYATTSTTATPTDIGSAQEARLGIKLGIIGDIFCDILCSGITALPAWNSDTLTSSIQFLAGGSALNTAVHAASYLEYAKRGKDVIITMHGTVGNDNPGLICIKKLEDHKIINRVNVLRNGDRTGSCVVLACPGDRAFVTDRGCVDTFSVTQVDLAALFQNDHIHVGGLYNCRQFMTECVSLLSEAKTKGITISLNPQYDALEQWEHISPLCPFVDFFICNVSEAMKISRKDDAASAAQVLLEWGCKLVLITVGSFGSDTYYYGRSEVDKCVGDDQYHGDDSRSSSSSSGGTKPRTIVHCHASAVNLTETVDATGAGDAFVSGAVLEWLLSGRSRDEADVMKCMQAGALTAAACVCSVGGSSTSVQALGNIAVQQQKQQLLSVASHSI